MAQLVKNPSAMRETWAQSLGWEDPLEKGKATHFSILARRIPGTALSMESQRVDSRKGAVNSQDHLRERVCSPFVLLLKRQCLISERS